MHYQIDLQDSEIAEVRVDGDRWRIRFSAATAIEAATGTEGYLLGVDMSFTCIEVQGDASQAFGRVIAAQFHDGDRTLAALPVPYEAAEPVRLEMNFRGGEQLIVTATGLRVQAGPDTRFRESYAC